MARRIEVGMRTVSMMLMIGLGKVVRVMLNAYVGHNEDLPGQGDEHFDRLLSIHTGPAHLDVPQAVQHQICLAVGDFRRDKLDKVHCFDKFHRQHLVNHICEKGEESKSGAWVSKG